MSQKIEEIKIDDLVLWTENPRDPPIDPKSSDQDVANKAWKDQHDKWNLLKLAKEMQEVYDFSELPTVVYHGKKPVVYDGNRRMILAKLKHDLVILSDFDKTKLPHIPKFIPCNRVYYGWFIMQPNAGSAGCAVHRQYSSFCPWLASRAT